MKIAIIGFGVEGRSALRYWSKQKADVTIHDQNEKIEVPSGVKSVLGKSAYDNLDSYGYNFLVRSPGNRLDAARITTPISSSTIEFFHNCPAPIIGVTGTKGKGTTCSLIAEFLKAAGHTVHLVGNIGEPCLDALSAIKPEDWVVFELSSFQLFDLHQSPHVAVHLMLESDHQDWHTSMAEYADAKGNIFRYQNPSDIAVYFDGSESAKREAELSPATLKIPYNRDMKSDIGVRVCDGKVYFESTPILSVNSVKLVGAHMLDNVCAAVAATVPILSEPDSLGDVDAQLYKRVLESFTGLPHRVQLVADINGVKYIDDSYSANPSAAQAGLRAFSEPKVVILGGYDKGTEFADLAQAVKDNNVHHAIVIGATAPKIIGELGVVGFKNYSTGFHTMHQVVAEAARIARSGDVVLLSPGCASFDMFKNFSDRGDQFIEQVKELKK